MSAAIVDDFDSPPIDPDDLKMPESPRHRRATDLIGLAAARMLGDEFDVFRDMNWYPPDDGNAIAPDVMVLPAGAWVAPPTSSADEPLKSYRQDQTGGPPPPVVVEVPSASDGFVGLLDKIGRCQRLGSVVYLVTSSRPAAVLRFDPDATPDRPGPDGWLDRPIPELGGISIGFEGDDPVVTLPDGRSATSDLDLLTTAEERADAAEDRAEALARQLRELGVEPQR